MNQLFPLTLRTSILWMSIALLLELPGVDTFFLRSAVATDRRTRARRERNRVVDQGIGRKQHRRYAVNQV